LRLVVDMDTAGRAAADVAALETLLAGLLRHPYLQVTRFSDNGPPAAAERLQLTDDRVASGWVTLADGVPGDRGGFCYSTGDHAAYTGYDPETAGRIARDATGAYTGLDPAEAQQQRDRDGVAMAVAMSLQPDLFVTDREHLLLRRDRSRYVTVCNTAESLAVLGLYLRSQGDFRYWFDPEGRLTPTCDKPTFFWVGARELLPAAWRWVNGCSQHSVAVGDDSLVYLALSALERMTQVLKYRDAVHRHLNQPVRDVRGDDAIEALEAALAMLLAAVDVTALVAHRVLRLTKKEARAGWQNEDWLSEAAQKCPGIDAVVAAGTPNGDAFTVLRRVRNSLHREALLGAGISEAGRAHRALMALPRNHLQDIVNAMDRMGGRTTWSVQPYGATELRVDPGTLLEMLLPRIAALLNDVMQATPVESLPHVTLTPADGRPPETADGIFDEFSTGQRACIRTLLGL
jgi:hypothetical protein